MIDTEVVNNRAGVEPGTAPRELSAAVLRFRPKLVKYFA